ncbi:MAG: hypothetical protein OHK0031_02650 [Anaerolineales bacterium]
MQIHVKPKKRFCHNFPMPIDFNLPLALLPLPFLLYAQRRRGWKYLLALTFFWMYFLALIDAVLFPIILATPEVGFDFGSTWEQLVHLYHYHGLNLIPLYFGDCWELANACRQEIIANILMTVPFGALYPLLRPVPVRRIPLLALMVGLGTESAQLLMILLVRTNYRSVDANDVLFNALGVMAGFGALKIWQISSAMLAQRISETAPGRRTRRR